MNNQLIARWELANSLALCDEHKDFIYRGLLNVDVAWDSEHRIHYNEDFSPRDTYIKKLKIKDKIVMQVLEEARIIDPNFSISSIGVDLGESSVQAEAVLRIPRSVGMIKFYMHEAYNKMFLNKISTKLSIDTVNAIINLNIEDIKLSISIVDPKQCNINSLYCDLIATPDIIMLNDLRNMMNKNQIRILRR